MLPHAVESVVISFLPMRCRMAAAPLVCKRWRRETLPGSASWRLTLARMGVLAEEAEAARALRWMWEREEARARRWEKARAKEHGPLLRSRFVVGSAARLDDLEAEAQHHWKTFFLACWHRVTRQEHWSQRKVLWPEPPEPSAPDTRLEVGQFRMIPIEPGDAFVRRSRVSWHHIRGVLCYRVSPRSWLHTRGTESYDDSIGMKEEHHAQELLAVTHSGQFVRLVLNALPWAAVDHTQMGMVYVGDPMSVARAVPYLFGGTDVGDHQQDLDLGAVRAYYGLEEQQPDEDEDLDWGPYYPPVDEEEDWQEHSETTERELKRMRQK